MCKHRMLEDACQYCQVFRDSPKRFRVSLPPPKRSFNREVAIGLNWLEGKDILHVLDTEKKFNSAMLLKYYMSEAVW